MAWSIQWIRFTREENYNGKRNIRGIRCICCLIVLKINWILHRTGERQYWSAEIQSFKSKATVLAIKYNATSVNILVHFAIFKAILKLSASLQLRHGIALKKEFKRTIQWWYDQFMHDPIIERVVTRCTLKSLSYDTPSLWYLKSMCSFYSSLNPH